MLVGGPDLKDIVFIILEENVVHVTLVIGN